MINSYCTLYFLYVSFHLVTIQRFCIFDWLFYICFHFNFQLMIHHMSFINWSCYPRRKSDYCFCTSSNSQVLKSIHFALGTGTCSERTMRSWILIFCSDNINLDKDFWRSSQSVVEDENSEFCYRKFRFIQLTRCHLVLLYFLS